MAKRGGFPGGGMPGNMANLMKQAQKMQRQMEENQKALEEKEFTAKAGGGAVEITVSGKKEITKVKLAEEVVDLMERATVRNCIITGGNSGIGYQAASCSRRRNGRSSAMRWSSLRNSVSCTVPAVNIVSPVCPESRSRRSSICLPITMFMG